MNDLSIRLDLRVVTIASVLVAIGLGVALLASEATDAALATTALVLAVIAFGADLAIALVFHMTNTQMQAALAKVDSRTDEVTNLVRLQGERLLDMIGIRVLESAPPDAREAVETVLGQMRHHLRDEPLLPPQGGVEGRRDHLRAELRQWMADHGYRLVGPERPWFEQFEADGVIHAVMVHPGPISRIVSVAIDMTSDAVCADWPDHDVRMAVLLEEPEISGWEGKQGSIDGLRDGTRVVTPSRLDELLLDPPSFLR